MKISVKCFAQLANEGICDYRNSTSYDMHGGAKVDDLVERLGIEPDDIKLIYVNNTHASPQTILHDGDRVAFAPATGGM